MRFKNLYLFGIASAWNQFFCGPSLAQTRGYDWHMGSGMMGGWGMGWFGGILMVILSALIIIGVVYLVKWVVNSTRTDTTSPPRALDILKERYARGEIEKEEFEEKKRDLLA